MNLSELIKEGRIREFDAEPEEVVQTLGLAERDLKTANSILENDQDWAFNIAYNAILQSVRALMFSKGYRPAGESQHITVVRFAEAVLGNKFSEDIDFFDRMRKKRHQAVYDSAGIISRHEAEEAIKIAEEFVEKVKEMANK